MELLERFSRGELEAFETLFRQFQAAVYAWVLGIVRDRSAAEDLTVETFWRIYRARARFDPSRPFEAWARRIATNVALDYLKTARVELVPWTDSRAERPSDPAIHSEVATGIQRAFSELSPKLRLAATLALIEQRPYNEIAEALGISVAGVKVRVFRAVQKLRRRLKILGIEP
jgi:RNA polymerase sigma-70 factor (ECF subfamily)